MIGGGGEFEREGRVRCSDLRNYGWRETVSEADSTFSTADRWTKSENECCKLKLLDKPTCF